MITEAARDDAAGITVEVGPGGGLRSIVLADRSLRLGSQGLATAIIDLVRTAAEQANRRVRHAVPDALHGMSAAELAALGVGVDAELAEAMDTTTPETWMR